MGAVEKMCKAIRRECRLDTVDKILHRPSMYQAFASNIKGDMPFGRNIDLTEGLGRLLFGDCDDGIIYSFMFIVSHFARSLS